MDGIQIRESVNQKALETIKKKIDRKRVKELLALLDGNLTEKAVLDVFVNLKKDKTHSQYNSAYFAFKKYLLNSTDSVKFRSEVKELFSHDELKPFVIGYNIKELPDRDNVSKAVKDSNPSLAYIIKFLANTGIRISELINVKLADVTFNGKAHIKFTVLKKRNPVEETIDQPKEFIKEIISHFHGNNKGTFLFQTRSGNQYNRVNLSNQIKAKLGFSAHKLRHYFAHEVYSKEGIIGVNKLLHQSSMDVTAKYLQNITNAVSYEKHYDSFEG